MMYVLGRIYAKQGNKLASDACYASAAAANLGDPDGHVRVGEFLMMHLWFDLARPELRRALGNGTEDPVARDALVYYQLSRCADSMGDDLLAATDLESAVAELRALPGAGIAQARIGLYTALTDWHRLRDAAQKNNGAELTRLVDKLMAGRQVGLDEVIAVNMDIDLARALKTLGRKEEGKRIFDEAYPKLHLKLDQAPHTAESLNNLAWLCTAVSILRRLTSFQRSRSSSRRATQRIWIPQPKPPRPLGSGTKRSNTKPPPSRCSRAIGS